MWAVIKSPNKVAAKVFVFVLCHPNQELVFAKFTKSNTSQKHAFIQYPQQPTCYNNKPTQSAAANSQASQGQKR